jgi:hypothetical protein
MLGLITILARGNDDFRMNRVAALGFRSQPLYTQLRCTGAYRNIIAFAAGSGDDPEFILAFHANDRNSYRSAYISTKVAGDGPKVFKCA